MPGLLWIWTLREARAGWRLLLSISLLIVIAGALLALAPVFRDASADRALERLLDQQPEQLFVSRVDRARQAPTAAAAAELDADIAAAGERHLTGLTGGSVRVGISLLGGVDSSPQPYPARFQIFEDLEQNIVVTEGRYPSQPRTEDGRLGVLVGAAAAGPAGIEVGDQWTFGIDVGLLQEARVEVVGLIEPRSADLSAFQNTDSWFELIPLGLGPPGIGLFVSPASLDGAVGFDLPGLRIDYFVQQRVDLSSLNSDDVRSTRVGMESFSLALRESPGTSASTPLVRLLRRFELEERFSETPVLVVALQMAAVAVFAVALLGADFARRSQRDRVRLRSRGASAWQEFRVQGAVGLLIALPAFFLSAPLAAFALSQAGQTSALDAITDGATLDTRLSVGAWALAAGTAVVAWFVFTGAVWLQRSGRGQNGRMGLLLTRPGVSLFHRYYLDFGLLVVAAVLFWQFDTESGRSSAAALGGDSVDPVLLLSPGLLIAAIALILARFLPKILERIARVAQATMVPTWIALALVALARDPGRAMRMLSLTLFAAAIGSIAATYSATLDESLIDRVRYEVGADLRAVAITPAASSSPGVVLSSLDGRDGVATAGAATRALGNLGVEASGSQTVLLGIQPERFGEIIEFRDDFATDSLAALFESIMVGSGPAGVELPANATQLSVWVRTEPADAEVAVEAQLIDGNGRPRTIKFGVPRGGEWQQLSGALPEPGPVRLLALSFGSPGSSVRAPAGSIWFDDLSVTLGAGEQVVAGFETDDDWFAGAGELPGGDVLELVGEGVFAGDGALRYDWTRLSSGDNRFLVRDSPGLPVPVAIDRGAAEASGLEIGDVLTFSAPQWAIPIRVVSVIELFPTLDPNNGSLLLADLSGVQSASRALSSGSGAAVTELWIDATSASAARALVADLDRIYLPTLVLDATEQLEAAESDPFSAAGAGGLFLVGFVGLLVVSLVTIVLSFASGAAERQTQVAVLRTLGYSQASASLQATLEVVLFLALGLGLGVVIGRAVSSALLGFLGVRADGSPIVPPVILHTDWGIAGLGLLILLGGALVVVFGLARVSSSRQPSEVLRLVEV